jgi:hypothetical protein
MRVTLQLTPAAARRAREPRARSAVRSVLPWLTQSLEPIHPDTNDPDLATFFTIDVADAREAAALVKRLCEDPSVEGAYIKPADELA